MASKKRLKPATNPAAKTARRDAILAQAAEAFDQLGHEATSMDWLAGRAGVAKGTLYLYFPTKEAVFLALYRRELDAWFAQIDAGLEKLAADDIAGFAGLVVDALDDQPRLPALAAIVHAVLERNVGEEDIVAFRRHMLEKVSVTGERVERKLAFLAADDGVRLLLRVHAMAIGCWHVAKAAPLARRVLARDVFSPLRRDFSEELENSLVLLLEGWRQSGGGF